MRKDEYEGYRAYLLRCWQERDSGTDRASPWRFAVEEVFGERRRQGFGSLEALLSFLRVELARQGSKPSSRKDPSTTGRMTIER
ncbi:MAG: hypothetical protein PVH41_00295 [Anaerolineae bacterium]